MKSLGVKVLMCHLEEISVKIYEEHKYLTSSHWDVNLRAKLLILILVRKRNMKLWSGLYGENQLNTAEYKTLDRNSTTLIFDWTIEISFVILGSHIRKPQ